MRIETYARRFAPEDPRPVGVEPDPFAYSVFVTEYVQQLVLNLSPFIGEGVITLALNDDLHNGVKVIKSPKCQSQIVGAMVDLILEHSHVPKRVNSVAVYSAKEEVPMAMEKTIVDISLLRREAKKIFDLMEEV